MTKKCVGDKFFKIIPEAKLVRGSTHRKYVLDNLNNLPIIERLVIHDAMCSSGGKRLWPLEDITANAYCDENDSFDENVGVMVCAAKLDLKNHVKMVKDCERAIEVLNKCVRFLETTCQKHRRKAIAIEEDLANTYGRLPV